MPDKFKQAIKEIYADGEFEKMIKCAPTRHERKAVKQFLAIIDSWKDTNDGIDGIPNIVLIHECKSYSVWQNALLYMEMKCKFDIEEDEKCE